MPRKKAIGWCSVGGCERPLKNLGLCQYHYNKKRLEEKPERAKAGLRGHSFYSLWFERKQNNLLCDEWLNFPDFIIGISPKPEGEFFLVRIKNEKFGPTNFKWEEHLRRKPDESAKDWFARKRAARISVNPGMESDRNIKRKFGLTREDYNKKLKDQNFVCAICENPETSINSSSGSSKRLAVDHNHKTNQIRDLLCWRCNTVIGRIDENLKLLDKIKIYLVKHLNLVNIKE